MADAMGYNFLYQDQGAPFRRARPAAARAGRSCLRRAPVSARVVPQRQGVK
jgi:hypothetical protein